MIEKHKKTLSDDSFFNAQSNVYNNRGEQGHFSWMPTKFWIPDYQALFLGKYQHHSLCRHTQIPEKKQSKTKKKNMWQYQQSVETHCPKGSPYNVKTKQKFEHFPCHIVPLFKLPVKKKLTLKLWLEERGEGCGLFCSLWSYPIWGHALNNFVADWRNDH